MSYEQKSGETAHQWYQRLLLERAALSDAVADAKQASLIASLKDQEIARLKAIEDATKVKREALES